MSRDPIDVELRATELLAAPVASTHQWIVENFRVAIDPHAGPLDAPPELLTDAHRLGLTHVGRKTESVGARAIASELFADPSHQAFISMRTTTQGGPYAAISSRYWIMTVFDDATALLTSALALPHMPSSERTTVRSGTNTLEPDLAAHLAAVAAEPTKRPLPARDHHDAERTYLIYYRQCVSADVVLSMQPRAPM